MDKQALLRLVKKYGEEMYGAGCAKNVVDVGHRNEKADAILAEIEKTIEAE